MRERQYTELLRRLWQKYKASDEELEREILQREREHDPENGFDTEDIFDDDLYKKKRTSYSPMVGYPSPMLVGYYGNSNVAFDKKKRGYPVLPWLPATRKKRFPIVLTKRSSPPIDHKKVEPTTASDKNLKKINVEPTKAETHKNLEVPKNLEEKKDSTNDEKKKKTNFLKKASSGDDDKKKRTVKKSDDDNKKEKKPLEEKLDEEKRVIVKKRDTHDEMLKDFETLWKQSTKKKKRQLGEDCDDDEDCGEHDHDVYEDHSEEDEDEDEESEEEEEPEDENRRKRKRAIRKRKRVNLEEIREEQIIPGDRIEYNKRSIDWSKIWGLDRKKKSTQAYPLDFYKTYDSDRRKKFDTEKLDNMDQKLKAIEDVLLDETVKYTGAHEGIVEPKEIAKLKDHVVSRLATAYSLEKMRQQLDKLKDTVESEKHLKHNEIPSDDEKGKEKRVAVKKEKAEFKHDE